MPYLITLFYVPLFFEKSPQENSGKPSAFQRQQKLMSNQHLILHVVKKEKK